MNNKTWKIFSKVVALSATIVLVACSEGKKGGGSPVNPTGPVAIAPVFSDTYKQFSSTGPEGSGCYTGVRNFTTVAQYCHALNDNGLMNHCAYQQRKTQFAKVCPHMTWIENPPTSAPNAAITASTNGNSNGINGVSPWHYSLIGPNCSVTKDYNTEEEYCAALKNDATNNNCAKAVRDRLYEYDCEKKTFFYEYFGFWGQCTTGHHAYKTKDEMCAALKDDELNQNCAETTRDIRYSLLFCD